jgi:diguanylate cyclase (GGDEF)-like protein
MAVESNDSSLTPTTVSATEIAESAHASDLFVFRRVGERRFAHIGGVGRGAGWAGIIEVGPADEPLVDAVFDTSHPVVRRSETEPWHVIGPYYSRTIAAVRVSPDVFVVFGSSDDEMSSLSDEELVELGRFASDALVEVAPAKRLADEIEALNAVRDLLHAPAETFDEALQRLVDHATTSLSCDLGLLYVEDGRRVVISDKRDAASLEPADVVDALAEVAQRETFPLCIQEATADELPSPLRSTDGVLAYYLLSIERPLPGLLLLVHTSAAAPRGFTLLCQSLGRRLVDAAEPLLVSALLRDTLRDELDRAATQARRDPLTGLSNRLAWDERLASASSSTEVPTSVVLLDCRGLKAINDTYGHRIGDEQLCRIAVVLRASVRVHDLVARFGGDEFGILLFDATEEKAQAIVERIETGLRAERKPGHPEIRLAIGTATSRDADLEGALRRADAEMLEQKRHFRTVSTR